MAIFSLQKGALMICVSKYTDFIYKHNYKKYHSNQGEERVEMQMIKWQNTDTVDALWWVLWGTLCYTAYLVCVLIFLNKNKCTCKKDNNKK